MLGILTVMFAAVTVFFIARAVYYTHGSQNAPKATAQDAQPAAQPPDQQPQQPVIETNKGRANTADDPNHIKRAERIQIAVNALLLLVIFWQLVAISIQAYIYNQQREVMRKQWIAMRRSLIQIKRQTTIAAESILINNRASVGVHSIDLNKNSKIVFVKIENIGKMPAKDINLLLELLTNTGKRKKIEKTYGATELFRGNLQITIPIRLGAKFLSGEEIRRIEESYDAMVLRGSIDYTDGFIREPRKHTQFFFIYDGQADCWSADAPEPWNALFDMEPPAR